MRNNGTNDDRYSSRDVTQWQPVVAKVDKSLHLGLDTKRVKAARRLASVIGIAR